MVSGLGSPLRLVLLCLIAIEYNCDLGLAPLAVELLAAGVEGVISESGNERWLELTAICWLPSLLRSLPLAMMVFSSVLVA